MVALGSHFEGGQHAYHFFCAGLHGAAVSVMRRTADRGGSQQDCPSEDQTRALGSAQSLAAAVADEGRAALQVAVGDGELLGRRIADDRYVLLLGDAVA